MVRRNRVQALEAQQVGMGWLRAHILHLSFSLFLLAFVAYATTAQAAESAAPPAVPATSAPPIAEISATAAPETPKSPNVPAHNSAATWRDVRGGVSGFTTVKGTETGVLVSSQGNTWRAVRNGLITPYGGLLLLVVAGLIAFFHHRKGTFKLHAKPTGRRMERFTLQERRAHWLVAISFVTLAVTGFVLLFGKHTLLWLLGYTLFSWLGWLSKNLHVIAGFAFAGGVVIMIKLFWRDNFWHRSDAAWIKKAGGLLTREHVPSGRFNFGEKTWFWGGVGFFGSVMIGSGLALTFPNFFDTRGAMQIAEMIHAASACVVIALSFGHIYMGTLGMEGAFEAMRDGYVDEAWAKEHHELWYQEKLAAQKLAHEQSGQLEKNGTHAPDADGQTQGV